MRAWVDCQKSMNDAVQMRATLVKAIQNLSLSARVTRILANRKTIIALAKSTRPWVVQEYEKHSGPGWHFREFCGVDLAYTDLIVAGVFAIERERRDTTVAWGVPAPGGKARPPRVAMYHPKEADKGKQDEHVESSALASSPNDETDNQERDAIFRNIFSS